MSSYDVLVIGAGPAGAVCARGLAAAGLATGIIDRAAPPRYKTCGGGVIGRAVAHLGIDVEPVIERVCRRVEMNLLERKPRGAWLGFEVERRDPVVVMTMRAELDRALVGAAMDDGAELVAPCVVSEISRGNGKIRVGTDRGILAASMVVGADGANSMVARLPEFGSLPRSVPAIESEIRVAPRDLERFSLSARFDFGWLDHGYCWVFPKREHLSVGCLSGKRGVALKRSLDAYLEQIGLGRPVAREDHGFVIPVAPRRGALARDGLFLVGDAAGLADPVTFEGISSALVSGRLAARSIVESKGDPAASAAAYQRALEEDLLVELRYARVLAVLLYGAPPLRRRILNRLGQKLAETMTDVISGERTYRDLAGNPKTWMRGLAAFFGFGGERE